MPVGDTVTLAGFNANSDPNMPVFGLVNVDPGGGADVEVLWRNGERPVPIPTTELDKVFIGAGIGLVGRWAQLLAYDELDSEQPEEGGLPKSPAAQGLIIEAWGTGSFGGAEPNLYSSSVTELGDTLLIMLYRPRKRRFLGQSSRVFRLTS